ncbi:MAG: CPBP family intramembrane glutamic endopeptidase [Psychroflexus sp.]|nr:CPBP family intramembrane glutamic endopeptidase [Psychroflexus sp.]
MRIINIPDFFKNGFNGFHEWWRYVAGAVIIFIIWQMGQIPLIGAIMYKSYQDGIEMQVLLSPDNIMTVLPQNLTFFLLLLSFVIGFLGIYFVVRFLHQQKILSSLTSRSKFDWRRFLFAFTLIGILIILTTLIDYNVHPDHYQLNFDWSSFLILAIIGIVMVPIQTTFEEWYFRGYLMQGLGYIFKNRAVPFITTSLMFGLLHIANPEVQKLGYIIMINYVGVGFFLGIITLMDEGLELAAGFHAANNLVTALLVTADWTAFNTPSILKDVSEPEVTFDVLLPIFILYPILILIMAKTYRWNNWSQKLFGKINLNDDFK